MKIVFLDIDGVLNNSRMTDSIGEGLDVVSKSAVDIFNEFTDETDAKIVISSTWRHVKGRTHEGLVVLLQSLGLTGDIIGQTPVLRERHSLRGNEIYGWLKENGALVGGDFNSYVIIDDDSDMLLWQARNFVSVDNYTGITPNTTYKAKRILDSFK